LLWLLARRKKKLRPLLRLLTPPLLLRLPLRPLRLLTPPLLRPLRLLLTLLLRPLRLLLRLLRLLLTPLRLLLLRLLRSNQLARLKKPACGPVFLRLYKSRNVIPAKAGIQVWSSCPFLAN
jgi:hypothetical protein